MLLRLLVAIGMISFCLWQILQDVNAPGPAYLPLTYIGAIILIGVGLNKKGLFTWPLATILLLIEGHWIIGWIPVALVTFTVIGNEWLDKKYPTHCKVCKLPLENGQEIVDCDGTIVHAHKCSQTFQNDAMNQ